MRTIGDFLELVESHKDHLWFIAKGVGSGFDGPYGWGKISLGGYTEMDFPYTMACLELIAHPEKKGKSTIGILDISMSLYHALLISSAFRIKKIRLLEGIYSVSALVELRRRLIKILEPLERR